MKRNRMKKTTVFLALLVIVCLIFTGIPAAADNDLIEIPLPTVKTLNNLYDPAAARSGLIAADHTADGSADHYASAELTAAAGETYYFGPADPDQDLQLMFWDGNDTATAVSPAALTLIDSFDNGQAIYKYTVTAAGTLCFAVPAAYNAYYLISKSRSFTVQKFHDFWDEKGGNLYRRLLDKTGATLEADGSYQAAAENGCTHFIAVSAGNTVSFGPARAQAWYLCGFSSQKTPVTGQITAEALAKDYDFGDGSAIYTYTVPSGVAYVRIVNETALAPRFVAAKNAAVTAASYYRLLYGVSYKVSFMVGKVLYAEGYTDDTGALVTAPPAEIPARTLLGWEDGLGNAVDPAAGFTADTVLYAKAAAVDSASATLNDTVQMNMNLDLDFYEKAVTGVTVTGPDANGENGTEPVETVYGVGTDLLPGADGRYLIDWPVAAAQITDPISVTVTYSDLTTQTILSNYSVQAYFEAVRLSAGSNAGLTALCDAALQYGACAQKAFDYKADALAAPITATPADWSPAPDEYKNAVTGTRAATGLSRVTTSALLRDKVALRMYVTLAEGENIDDFTFSFTGEDGSSGELTPRAENGERRYSVTLSGIVAAKFGTRYTFTVANGARNTAYTLQTGVLNYGRKVLESDTVTDDMKTLVCAMKAYYDAAAAFFHAA